MSEQPVIVVGAGIAGLTASALLAHEGVPVILLESHHQPGGCAGTFCRGNFVFDVGATQVAGFEVGGIHERIFRHLQVPLPVCDLLNPGCVVQLADGSHPIQLWHDPMQWAEERERQFPGSKAFWRLCTDLHNSNWEFASRNPVLPASNVWDFWELIRALRPNNLLSGIFSTCSVSDLLFLTGCQKDQRLTAFLDLQLKLYSQEPAKRTAALYGSTVLQMAQKPLGLWHLHGSMQKLSESLANSLLRDGAKLFLKHRVIQLKVATKKESWRIDALDSKGLPKYFSAPDVIFTLPPQSLLDLMPLESGMPKSYRRKLSQLPQPSGALVFYGALDRNYLPSECPTHLQIEAQDPGSVFLSISREGDGRAPAGQATVIASIFAECSYWMSLDESNYRNQKQLMMKKIIQILEHWLGIAPHNWLHKELATPRSFAKWTGRPGGMVGGLGQQPLRFGPFGLHSRTPMNGLWLCGDSIYPGEGTAGVSQSALMACRQLMAQRNKKMYLVS